MLFRVDDEFLQSPLAIDMGGLGDPADEAACLPTCTDASTPPVFPPVHDGNDLMERLDKATADLQKPEAVKAGMGHV